MLGFLGVDVGGEGQGEKGQGWNGQGGVRRFGEDGVVECVEFFDLDLCGLVGCNEYCGIWCFGEQNVFGVQFYE